MANYPQLKKRVWSLVYQRVINLKITLKTGDHTVYLLNVIYKIGSSGISNRVKRILPTLIDDDQTGCISNSYIGGNVGLIYGSG